MPVDPSRARWPLQAPILASIVASICAAPSAGCGLTDLHLGGGAHVTDVTIENEAGYELAIDATQPLVLTLVYDDGFEEAAHSADVTWSIDDPQVAAIDGGAQLRGRQIGATGVTARYAGRTATAMVKVFDQPQALEIQASDRNCAVGEQLAYGLLLRYQHGATELVAARASWTSDQPEVASVEAGMVKGRAVGDTRVNATLGALATSADVHVAAAVAVRVDVAPATLQLTVGSSQAVRATALYSDGNMVDATQLVRWQSSLPAVANVTSGGTVTGLTAGTVKITATRDAAVGTVAVTVVVP
jgi:hypothetical protein